MLVLKLAVFFVLILVFIQDIRSRSVYWVLFPLLILLFILLRRLLFIDDWQSVLINVGFLSLQLLLVSIYFSIRHKARVIITDNLLGWGDILFLLSIAFYLSVLNFLFFYIISLSGALLIWLTWQRISKEKSKQIPLAGLQALIFTVFLTCDWWFGCFSLTNDEWLLHLVTK